MKPWIFLWSWHWRLNSIGVGGPIMVLGQRRVCLPSKGNPSRVYRCFAGTSVFSQKLMKPLFLRKFIHWLIYQPWLRKRWEQKLFLFPEKIPLEIRNQFFEDYPRCEAFPVLFDLIDADWYRSVQKRVGEEPFYFLWGEKERVIAAKHLQYWQKDFPNATFEVVPEWDHFPMLDQPTEFCDYLYTKFLTK